MALTKLVNLWPASQFDELIVSWSAEATSQFSGSCEELSEPRYNDWMGSFKHSCCNNCEPHDPSLVSRVRSGERAADYGIGDETQKNKKREDDRALVGVVSSRGRRATPRRDKMRHDYTEAKKDRYHNA